MNLSIVILAAGLGTRMKSKTAKVLHKICGKSMLWHIIDEAKQISDDITVVVYNQYQTIIDEFSNYNLNFTIQDYKNYPGTAGALKDVKPKYDNVLVLNGDMPLVNKDELIKFIDDDYDITLGILRLKNPFGYGRVIIKNSCVKKIVEQKDADEKTLKIKDVNSGVYLFKKEILTTYLPKISNDNQQKEYYLTDIISLSVKNNKKIKPLFVNPDSFLGVNSKIDLAYAQDIMLDNIRQKHMKNGVIMKMPKTIYIEKSVKIEGESIIENGVSLIENTTIKNSHIKTNSIIENANIIDSSIGPMARIRPNSNIKNSHIGNFVETKNVNLDDIKSGHLTYLGDIDIDSKTNIGAGTIICNYDGKKKHKSKIGKNVFIGSNTKLISPVTIEDDVIIAAGSTINQNVNRGELAISRSATKIIKNFYYKFFGNR